jgi:hypothetical protein
MIWQPGTLRLNFALLTKPKRAYVAMLVLRGRIVEITEAKPWWRAVAAHAAGVGGWIPPDRRPPDDAS